MDCDIPNCHSPLADCGVLVMVKTTTAPIAWSVWAKGERTLLTLRIRETRRTYLSAVSSYDCLGQVAYEIDGMPSDMPDKQYRTRGAALSAIRRYVTKKEQES